MTASGAYRLAQPFFGDTLPFASHPIRQVLTHLFGGTPRAEQAAACLYLPAGNEGVSIR